MAVFEQHKFDGGAEYTAYSGPLKVEIVRFDDPDRQDELVVWDLGKGEEAVIIPLRKVHKNEMLYHYGEKS